MSSPQSRSQSDGESFTVRLNSQLTHREVDRLLRSTGLFRQAGWPSGSSERLTIDMSAVEFSDLAACARLIVTLEGAIRHGRTVTVIPPAANVRPGEHDLIIGKSPILSQPALRKQRSRIATSVQGRRRGSTFLANTGFFSAIQMPHLPDAMRPVLTEDKSTWSSEIEYILSAVTTRELTAALPLIPAPSHMRGSEAILPFTWLTSSESAKGTRWENGIIDFLHGREPILTRRDAISIVTTVLRELVDNVFEHAGVGEGDVVEPPAALIVGLGVRRGRSVAWKKAAGLYPADLPFNEWLSQRESPLVRILVADSGVGIPSTLKVSYQDQLSHKRTESIKPGDLILHSFEPSASRHTGDRRGLGLAVVRRYVRSYAGRVTIRSANANGGYWFPEAVPEVFADDGLAYAPGTVVEVALGVTLRQPGGLVESLPRQHASADLVYARIGTRFSDVSRWEHTVTEALRSNASAHPILVLLIPTWPDDRFERMNIALGARTTAKGLEGKAGLAVVLPAASEPDIRSSFAPFDDLVESDASRRQSWDLGEWTPPTLIIAANGSAIWTGGSARIRKLLYSLLAGHSVDMNHTIRGFSRRSAERDYLNVERDWLSVDGEAKTRMRVTLGSINALVANRVEDLLLREARLGA